MEDSILYYVKDAAGVNIGDDAFDGELILHINTAFMTLRQLGVGPETPFTIEDDGATWDEFSVDASILPMVKSYIALKVRILFDPPASSVFMNALQDSIREYEWRLNIEADKYKVEEDEYYANRVNSNR